MEKKYLILAYYHFVNISDPRAEVVAHQLFFQKRDVTGRIYLSEQGINGQMSGSSDDISDYLDWMKEHPLFREATFKIHSHHENVFPRMTVKYRKQLVALDTDVDLSKRGEHLSPARWQRLLEEKKDRLLLDVRNDYEWKIGHFDGSELPALENFRDFSRYAEQLKERINPEKTAIMMYCTGGIRCEFFSALLKEKGFKQVYQLEGGIINYGLKVGAKHWKGKVFVFDDRLAIPISEKEESSVISHCHHCNTPNDVYYNCANMDCNALFLSCPECLKKFMGCCQQRCMESERLRPYCQQNAHKPFRKWYYYQ